MSLHAVEPSDPNPEGALTYKDADGDEVLDVRRLRPKARKLLLPIDDAGNTRVFKVDGSRSLDLMVTLYAREEELNESEGSQLKNALKEVSTDIVNLLRETNDDVPELVFGRTDALAVLAYLSGNASVAQAFHDAITAAGLGDGEKPDAVSSNAKALAEDHLDRESDADEGPLASASPSRSRSSRSEKPASGGLNGGEIPAVAGKPSRSTSRKRSERAAAAAPS